MELESEWAASLLFCQLFVSPIQLCLLSIQKAVWNAKPIKWKHAKPDCRFCLHLLLVQVSSWANYFDCFPRLAVHFDFQSALCHMFRLQKALCVMWTWVNNNITTIISRSMNASISVSICCHFIDPFKMWRQNLWTGGQDKRKSPRCNEVYYHAKSNPLFRPPVQLHSQQLKGVYTRNDTCILLLRRIYSFQCTRERL